jgi:hypothetical protein
MVLRRWVSFGEMSLRWRQLVGLQLMSLALKKRQWLTHALFLLCPAAMFLTLPMIGKLLGSSNAQTAQKFRCIRYYL